MPARVSVPPPTGGSVGTKPRGDTIRGRSGSPPVSRSAPGTPDPPGAEPPEAGASPPLLTTDVDTGESKDSLPNPGNVTLPPPGGELTTPPPPRGSNTPDDGEAALKPPD